VKYLPKGQAEVVRKMRTHIRELQMSGLKTVNIYNAWLGRHFPPLRTRAHLMCEYKGKNDPTQVFSAEWSEEEYEKALGRITGVAFSSLSEPLQPFDVDKNPAPEVNSHHSSIAFEYATVHPLTPCLQTFRRIVDWLPPPRRGGIREAQRRRGSKRRR
jgi:hypothetical protein